MLNFIIFYYYSYLLKFIGWYGDCYNKNKIELDKI